jgi:hypothetical protein
MLGLKPPGDDRGEEDCSDRCSDHDIECRPETALVGLEKGSDLFLPQSEALQGPPVPKEIFSFHGESSHQVPVWLQDDEGSEGDPPGWMIQSVFVQLKLSHWYWI